MHNGATELQHCLEVTHLSDWQWNKRNFNVDVDMIEKVVDTFFHYQVNSTKNTVSVSLCSDWRKKGEDNGFAMYNLICKGKNGAIKLHHYYNDSWPLPPP